ncbi:hypothetical protein A2W14_07145 [Candidatus Gottesmanbacteria bacterium RBG_16_37_8]|uniref:SpoVT-AbrB domain-containing protein n=1 Tax=Candidatus Gottesmanbacteria bacterium RBG_16_37_8 TaxID=1798371 RepID=A0A1F5YNB3_9BACT|nr:MAG: hypothetical protein A2W14_07145 [Candidatus Gottesmanbacteria bacterium RBG_16_37_8]
MIQKIIKVGNSAALTLPKNFLIQSGLRVGEEMSVETNIKAKMVLAKPVNQKPKMSLTPEFFDWLDRISQKYENTIKELAKI